MRTKVLVLLDSEEAKLWMSTLELMTFIGINFEVVHIDTSKLDITYDKSSKFILEMVERAAMNSVLAIVCSVNTTFDIIEQIIDNTKVPIIGGYNEELEMTYQQDCPIPLMNHKHIPWFIARLLSEYSHIADKIETCGESGSLSKNSRNIKCILDDELSLLDEDQQDNDDDDDDTSIDFSWKVKYESNMLAIDSLSFGYVNSHQYLAIGTQIKDNNHNDKTSVSIIMMEGSEQLIRNSKHIANNFVTSSEKTRIVEIFTLKDNTLLVVNENGSIDLIDIKSGSRICSYCIPNTPKIVAAAISKNKNILHTVDADGVLRILQVSPTNFFDRCTKQILSSPLREKILDINVITDFGDILLLKESYANNLEMLVSSYSDNMITTPTAIKHPEILKDCSLFAMNGGVYAVGKTEETCDDGLYYCNNSLNVYDTTTHESIMAAGSKNIISSKPFSAIAISNNERFIAIAYDQDLIDVVDLKTRDMFAVCTEHKTEVRKLCISDDAKYLAIQDINDQFTIYSKFGLDTKKDLKNEEV